MDLRPMVALTGPTAVGKTELSLMLAERIDGEIISADSIQVYRHMDIGSAKILPEKMRGIPHHLIDILDPDEDFNVVVFKQKCEQALEGIYARKRIPILTGGTGFYIQAVLRNIDFTDTASFSVTDPDTGEVMEYREYLENLAREKGAEYLHGMLAKRDPAAANQIHANNIKRTIRALEYFEQTGEKISEHNEQERKRENAFNACYFVLNDKREKIYEKINLRVDEMIREGLVEEAARLKGMGVKRDMVSAQGLGYKEMFDYLAGEISLDEAVYRIKRDTRHFAKRQLTWFKREKDVIWVNKDEFGYEDGRILDFMMGKIVERGLV